MTTVATATFKIGDKPIITRRYGCSIIGAIPSSIARGEYGKKFTIAVKNGDVVYLSIAHIKPAYLPSVVKAIIIWRDKLREI